MIETKYFLLLQRIYLKDINLSYYILVATNKLCHLSDFDTHISVMCLYVLMYHFACYGFPIYSGIQLIFFSFCNPNQILPKGKNGFKPKKILSQTCVFSYLCISCLFLVIPF